MQSRTPDKVQRAHFCKLSHFILAKLRHATHQIVDIRKRPLRPFTNDRARRIFAKTFYVSQAKPEMGVGGWGAGVGSGGRELEIEVGGFMN